MDLKRLGKYEIMHLLGEGGMGKVYLASDPFAGQAVALKISRATRKEDPDSSAMYQRLFYNELHTAGQLKHPNILQVLDAGLDQEYYYIVLEYVPGGRTLADLITPGFSEEGFTEKLTIILKCAEALDYAHRRGVVHRDIKPANILLGPDSDIKLADFGIALLMGSEAMDTQPVRMVGSPVYMSPEALSEDSETFQSDLFSLGIVMYELLSGHHPFEATHTHLVVERILRDEPQPINAHCPGMTAGVSTILSRLLAKQPQQRYASALDLVADLSLVLSGQGRWQGEAELQERMQLMRSMAFFQAFRDGEMWDLVRWADWQEFEDGQEIVRESESGDSVYIIVSGELLVSKSGQQLAVLGPGEIFGEIAYLTQRRRTATVRARGPVTVMSVNEAIIEKASLGCRLRFQQMFIATLIDRLVATTERLTVLSAADNEDGSTR